MKIDVAEGGDRSPSLQGKVAPREARLRMGRAAGAFGEAEFGRRTPPLARFASRPLPYREGAGGGAHASAPFNPSTSAVRSSSVFTSVDATSSRSSRPASGARRE
jgi:hypothetical protein